MLEKEINKDVENLEYKFNNSHKSSKKFNFSIIMAIYNTEKFLEEAIESVINQTIGFKENVELILVDDGSEDKSSEICLKYVNKFPENIKYFYQENQGQATARNNGMKVANAKYLNFLDSDDKLESNALELVYNFFKKNHRNVDIVSIPIKFFDRQSGDHILNYKYKTTRVVDLIKEPNYIQLSASASFFKKDSIKDFIFDPDLIVSEDAIFLNKILLKKKKLGVVSNTCYFYRKRFTFDSTVDSSIKDKDYYLQRSQIFFKELFEYCKEKYGEIFDFIKYTVMYDIQWIFDIRNVEEILEKNDLITLKKYLHELLQEIDDEIILNQKYPDKNLKYTILIFKHGNIDTEVLEEEHNVKKIVNETTIDELYYHRFYIDAFEIHENKVSILGFLKSYFIYPEINIQAVHFNQLEFFEYWERFFNENKILFFKRDFLNNKGLLLHDALLNKIDKNNENLKKLLELDSESEIKFYDFFKENHEIENIDNFWEKNYIDTIFKNSKFIDKEMYNSVYNEIYNKFIEEKANIIDCKKIEYPYREKTYLNLNYTPNLNFELKINLNKKEDSIIKIRVVFDSLKFYLSTVLTNKCKITNDSFYSWKDDYLVKFKNNEFEIIDYSIISHLKLEESNLQYLESKKDSSLNEVIRFRRHYYYSFFKYIDRRIWLFMDRIDKADDNAEHLYRYAIEQNDNIEKYFVLSKDSKDFSRMQEIGNVVIAGSEEHKLLSCFAEKIISSQADDNVVNPFFGKYEKYYNGLFSAKIYFLQHGIIKEDISSWLHKYDKYLYLIVTSAKAEYDSFFGEDTFYNYDKTVVQLLGLPRHDKLEKLTDQKEIVIMPSWRRSLHNISDLNFKKSEFFKVYNNLLNDKKLIDFLESKGYKLIFKPHPNINKYLHLFDKDESVIYAETENNSEENSYSYTNIFNHSSLLITDYSSTVFDFALLKKPIIYYHYKDDYHFDIEDSYFDYETMGFGEIVKTHKDLVDLIIDYVNKNCNMKEKYMERVDTFFEFNDKNNCKRVYDFILNN